MLAAQKAAIELFVPGNTWGQATAAADEAMVAGLLDAGILQGGTVSELLARRQVLYSSVQQPRAALYNMLSTRQQCSGGDDDAARCIISRAHHA